MTVSREALEAKLNELRAEVAEPKAGIYGPDSLSWRVDREAVLFLGGGRAALLQLAHPFVAHAVNQHSDTRHDPLGRFQRTFDNVLSMVFGDLDRAFSCARRVHTIHTRIRGTIDEDVGCFARGAPYDANDEAALLWVHATLLDTSLQVYELVLGPLSQSNKEGYYRESKRFARLFGIPDDVLPQSYAAFADYFQGMLESDTIRVGLPAREMARFLLSAPRPSQRPLFRWLRIMTAGLLPQRQRQELQLPWGRSSQLVFDSSIQLLRQTVPRLPSRLRYLPAYIRAERRLAGRRGPDHVGRLLEHLALRTLRRSTAA